MAERSYIVGFLVYNFSMDIFAHALWTNIVFYKKYRKEVRDRILAILFGLLPDLFSFVPFFVYSFFIQKDFFEMLNSGVWVVSYAAQSYNYTHSIVFFFLAVLIVFIYRKFKGFSSFYWPMWGWFLHILIDIPTHKDFYETPFLFPFSDYRFSHGISWAHPVFMVINYSVLTLFYLYWFLVLRKKQFMKHYEHIKDI